MKNNLLKAVLWGTALVATGLIFSSFGSHNGPKSIMVGDSITWQWHTKRPDFFVDDDIVCAGVSGQVTAQMLERFDRDVVAKNPKFVTILGGINDIAQNQGYISNEDIVKNIVAMVEKAEQAKIKVVICSVLPSDRIVWRPEIDPVPLVNDLNERLKAYAKAERIPYLDYYSAFVTESGGLPAEFTTDGVHVTEKGYEQMERMYLDCLRHPKKYLLK